MPDPVEHLALLRRTVRDMRPAWVSEHLSFNRVTGPHGAEQTGFLLPPRQSAAGVRVAAANIDAFRAALNCPVAFETGTNYLRPRDDEMPDGEFFGAVCAGADCGILLDLHNLWCNERNGRAAIADVCFRRQPPDVFAAVEADQVARFLESRPDVIGRIPHLAELLAFEHAVLRAALYGEATDVEWTADPAVIFAALGARRLPDGLPQVAGSMRVSAATGTGPA